MLNIRYWVELAVLTVITIEVEVDLRLLCERVLHFSLHSRVVLEVTSVVVGLLENVDDTLRFFPWWSIVRAGLAYTSLQVAPFESEWIFLYFFLRIGVFFRF